jgi:hypothetical protein
VVRKELVLRKVPDNSVPRKAKANAVRGLRAAIARHAKADPVARAKGLQQDKGLLRKVPDNKVNPPVSHSAAVSVMAANAAAIAAHVRQLRGQPACSDHQPNSLARNLAAARNHLDAPAAVVAAAAARRAVKAEPADIKDRAAVADAAGNRADAATNRASSWPRPNRSRLSHSARK